jgi:6-pyruvoyltetrahydropterin/6-carboxytetrahydropterin synthase
MLVTKEFTFDSAHYLPHYQGKCEQVHGHTYKLQVTVKSPVEEETGLAMDFCELKEIVIEKVIKVIDHTSLNEIIPIPSAENIAIWIWEKLKNDLSLYEIKIWETPTSFITYHGHE